MLFSSLLAGVLLASSSPRIAPVPEWVDVAAIDVETKLPAADRSEYVLLVDEQVRLDQKVPERFQRYAIKVLSTAGLENANEVRVTFDPSYQDVVLHRIRILRGDSSIDVLDPKKLKVIQQEPDLSARIYDGRHTVLSFVEGLQVGDVLDYSFTVSGSNPVLGAAFTDQSYLGSSAPIGRLRYRLLRPKSREIHHRVTGISLAPVRRELGALVEETWSRASVAAVKADDQLPSWFDPHPKLELSEHDSWEDVRAWSRALVQKASSSPLSPALKAQIARWRASSPSKEAQLMTALHFVQEDIRYLGLEVGPNTHLPTPPSVTFERRFGDCKDKSLLLAAILRELGIEAELALVNTGARRALDASLPSQTAFDHVIVRARIDGQERWLDATRAGQRGKLAARRNPRFERALIVPLSSDQSTEPGLAVIAADAAPSAQTVEETFEMEKDGAPMTALVRTTYTGSHADSIRYELARVSRDEFERQALNYYASKSPKIRPLGAFRITDDEDANVVVIEERYELPDFWDAEERRDLRAYAILENVQLPSIRQRSMPLAITHPQTLRHEIKVKLPREWDIDEAEKTVDGPTFRFAWRARASGRELTLTYDYASKVDHVAVAGVADHFKHMEEMRDASGYGITYRTPSEPAPAEPDNLLLIAAFIGAFAGGMVLMERGKGLVDQRRTRARFQHGKGETAGTALLIPNEHALEREIARITCSSCKSRRLRGNGGIEPLTFGGRRMFTARASCGGCGGGQSVYFERA